MAKLSVKAEMAATREVVGIVHVARYHNVAGTQFYAIACRYSGHFSQNVAVSHDEAISRAQDHMTRCHAS